MFIGAVLFTFFMAVAFSFLRGPVYFRCGFVFFFAWSCAVSQRSRLVSARSPRLVSAQYCLLLFGAVLFTFCVVMFTFLIMVAYIFFVVAFTLRRGAV